MNENICTEREIKVLEYTKKKNPSWIGEEDDNKNITELVAAVKKLIGKQTNWNSLRTYARILLWYL